MPISSVSFTAQNKQQGTAQAAGNSILIPKADKAKGKMALDALAQTPDAPVKSVSVEGSYVVIKGDKGEVKIECDTPEEAAAMVNDYNSAVAQNKAKAAPQGAVKGAPPQGSGKKLYLEA